MSLLLSIIVLGVLGFLSGVLGGIIGFGTTILLVPPLIYFYGPVATIPVNNATTQTPISAVRVAMNLPATVCGTISP